MALNPIVPRALLTRVPRKTSNRSILKHPCNIKCNQHKTVQFSEHVQYIHPTEIPTEEDTTTLVSTGTITVKHTANSATIAATLDSGASYHFLQDTFNGTNHSNNEQGLPVETACGAIIKSNGTDAIPLPQVPRKARKCHKFASEDLNMPLLSVKQLCDSDLAVVFQKDKVQVIKPTASKVEVPGDTLIEGQVDPQTQLYMVNLPTNQAPITAPGGDTCIHNDNRYLSHKANLITIKPVQQLINFYHMTFGAPPISSWKKAIQNGWFTTWPGLTASRVTKYCSKKPETIYGHQRLINQHIQSTKPKPATPTNKGKQVRSKTHPVEVHMIDELENIIGMDITGRYLLTSARGNK